MQAKLIIKNGVQLSVLHAVRAQLTFRKVTEEEETGTKKPCQVQNSSSQEGTTLPCRD